MDNYDDTNACQVLRRHVYFSVRKFAEETGISHQTVYNMEYGRPCKIEVWDKIRARWGSDLEELGLRAEDFWGGSIEEREEQAEPAA